MLKIQALSQPNEHYAIRNHIDIHHETLVVADLHTKLEIQDNLLSQHGFIEGNLILRAHELWIQILSKIRPDIKVISSTLARTLIMQWLDKENLPWARTSHSAANVFQYIQQLLPIISDPSSYELMRSWFEAHPNSLIRWGNWFNLSVDFWCRFQSLNLLPNSWVSAYLSSTYEGQKVWNKKIIFDLSCDLSPVESDLLLQMEKNHEIEVIQPKPPWANEYLGSQLGYQILSSKSFRKTRRWYGFF